MRARVIAAFIAGLSVTSLAGAQTVGSTLEGNVIAIEDGDTLTLLDGSFQKYRLRLSDIDAPEAQHGKARPGQPFNERSKQNLAKMCFGVTATALITHMDTRYGRPVARIRCKGQDANLEQVKAGLAWFNTKYSHDQVMKAAEVSAREARMGLWADPDPVPPWEWRRTRWSN